MSNNLSKGTYWATAYKGSETIQKLETIRVRLEKELTDAKRQHLEELFYSDSICDGSREKFLMIFKSIDGALENGFEKAIRLLEVQIEKNKADGTATVLVRDKRIDKIIDENK